MTNKSNEIVRLKQNLLINSGVELLQSIDEVKRLCQEQPEHIETLLPLISSLSQNKHPWVKKEAIKCIGLLKKLKKQYKRKGTPNKRGSNIITTISDLNEYIDFLLKMLKEKQNHENLIQDLYLRSISQFPENFPTIKEQLYSIVKNKTPDYLEILFTKKEIMLIALIFGIDVNDKGSNIDLINLEIYNKLGFSTDRSDYLEM